MKIRKLFQTLFLLLPGLLLLACSDEPAPASDASSDAPAVAERTQDADGNASETAHKQNRTAQGLSMTETAKDGYFQVTLQSEVTPLPLNEIHSWTAQVTTSEGRIVDDAIVMVYGGMPEHKHGFPSKPRVTGNLGNGRYRIEGVKFNMPGRWEMWINVRALGKDDKAIFSFDVP